MKAIATVNFKGGVGKTTITWLLAKYAAEIEKAKVLVVDTDAQMSLTMAVQLNEEKGTLVNEFQQWYDNTHKKRNKTILSALDAYDQMKEGRFDFPINSSFIYEMSETLHFIPSEPELYWLELDVFDREKVKHFIRALMGKMQHSKGYNYDYIMYDCPPNFTALSYSVLSCCSLILIPVNPDVFASRGVSLMLEGLRYRIEPWPSPEIAVFMNKAKLRSNRLTRETQQYWNQTKDAVTARAAADMKVTPIDCPIPDRVDIKRAIPGRYFPQDYITAFKHLWDNVRKLVS